MPDTSRKTTATAEQREEYYKVLLRFQSWAEKRGEGWVLKMHRFMLETMGEAVSDPAIPNHYAERHRPRPESQRRRGGQGTMIYVNTATGEEFLGASGAAASVAMSDPCFYYHLKRGNLIGGAIWTRRPAKPPEGHTV